MRLTYLYHIIQFTRDFFQSRGFTDVLTPPLVQHPGIETHIHPFEVYSKHKKQSTLNYLHSSPEFSMKKLLALDDEKLRNIFTICYCFRDEPRSPTHREQFIMLEWYRSFENYQMIISDMIEWWDFLVQSCLNHNLPINKEFTKPYRWTVKTMSEVFQEYAGFDILNYLNSDDLRNIILQQLPQVPVATSTQARKQMRWDDYFFLVFLNVIEPELGKYPLLIIKDFPSPLKALSVVSTKDPRVCERFEVYIHGIEIGNCFSELTDPVEQHQRVIEASKDKKELHHYQLPYPEDFMSTMKSGLPQSSGIAVGIERLAHKLLSSGSDHLFWE